MDIGDLLDRAKARMGIKSDRQFSQEFNTSANTVLWWRKGKTMPSDDNLVALATLAGEDPAPYLLQLNMLRSGDKARAIYSDMLAKLERTAA